MSAAQLATAQPIAPVPEAPNREPPNIVLRPARERSHADHGWLTSAHTFSFANYYDPAQMGFRALRVINEDVVRPETGFGMHGHRDMEIISYVMRGTLAHEDSTGGKGALRRGDVQYMSAGTGIRHSEFNGSSSEDVHFLQIWILPPRQGLPPSYRQESIADDDKLNTLKLIAAPDGAGGVLVCHRDIRVFAGLLEPGATVTHMLGRGRGAWIQLVSGSLEVDGLKMTAGDGLAIEETGAIGITAQARSELLLFDLD